MDGQEDPGWKLLPLTHITKALIAEDIVRAKSINPTECDKIGDIVAYFYYGRPSYRANKDEVVKVEAACPVCFILDGQALSQAKRIFAFDSGAFLARMYKHVIIDEMQLDDFSLGNQIDRPNKLISATFSSQRSYLDGDRSSLTPPAKGAESWQYAARSYLELLASPGRNEPDDRVCSIEVLFDEPVPLSGALLAIVVPHTHWRGEGRSPWLIKLEEEGVAVVPYNFIPGRHPEYYQTQIEAVVQTYYKDTDRI